MTIDGITTVQQVIEEIGQPSDDTTEAGHVLDWMIQNIIDEEVEWMTGVVNQRILERQVKGSPLLASDKMKKVTIEVAASTDFPMLFEGTIPSRYYPFPFKVVTPEGYTMKVDPNIETTALVSYYAKYRYGVMGRTLYALPAEAKDLVVWLADANDVITELGADLVPKVNDRILARSRQMLKDRIVEGTRLEQDPQAE